MSLVVNTNVGSLNAQRSLTASASELKTAMERLSSGKKINSAADDAAGFAIAERMTAQIRGLNMATKNVNDGLSMLAVIDNATDGITDMLHRMRELTIQATNDTNSTEDRSFLQKEVNQLISEIDRVASQTVYNGQTVLDGSFTSKSIQVGTEKDQVVSFSVSGVGSTDLGLSEVVDTTQSVVDEWSDDGKPGYKFIKIAEAGNQLVEGDTITFSNDADSKFYVIDEIAEDGPDHLVLKVDITHLTSDELNMFHADADGSTLEVKRSTVDLNSQPANGLVNIANALSSVTGQRAEYGALQNRLEYTVSNLMNVAEFTTAARSRIEDADFAAESARLAKAQVLQQTGTAMLAQANASPQLALSLIR